MTTRDMAKKAVRNQISLAALARFKTNGFDKTTIEDIAGDVGMSIRTFFRYFRAKEDVLLAPAVTFSDRFLSEFANQLPDHDLWSALGRALEAGQTCEKLGDRQQALEIQQMVEKTPALLARQLAIIEQLQVDATGLAMGASPEATDLGWCMTDAIIRSGFSYLRAALCCEKGDTQNTKTIEQLRALMEALKPAVLVGNR
ncbi:MULTISPECIES: TetR/AcrR family transcriptional regulator [Yersiniaceae]|uniref:TetR/AcrR family transcriptional regulator n=1 Tax=Yersiniaceae TaxID=1903411 RepID=UPI0009A23BED|nr:MULTISPECIES: TetR family transcriptional regulator [Yersiniaceae]MDV5142049.1 TetR family transcriptional regulator [Chimaeribacter arupi]PLR32737.1 hypothetical protein CYR23_13640 [Chimaeribacter arupi]